MKYIDMLIKEETLPLDCDDHKLYGSWSGHRDLHIEGDWILVYRLLDKKSHVLLVRTGSHAEVLGM
ncbi:hypothetical protein FACS1894133_5320 [Clostridia bacterium]|nr:hypothetical protein FACS1894133_5320 [Clostridia bacterium]